MDNSVVFLTPASLRHSLFLGWNGRELTAIRTRNLSGHHDPFSIEYECVQDHVDLRAIIGQRKINCFELFEPRSKP